MKRTHKGKLRDVLARNMRRLRAARGLSQEALAHDCGINRTYLSSVERSERNVSIDNIARIARGLQIESWHLLKGLLNSLRRANRNSGKSGHGDGFLEVENLTLKLRMISKSGRILLLSRRFRP